VRRLCPDELGVGLAVLPVDAMLILAPSGYLGLMFKVLNVGHVSQGYTVLVLDSKVESGLV
jgi:hypothetical protein